MGAKPPILAAGQQCPLAHQHRTYQLRSRRSHLGGKPYAIPAGASDHPLGGLGYAHFADELAAQEAKEGVFFDTVVTATCTGSTQAGMVVGFGAQDRRRRLIGIDTAADAAMTRAAVTNIARATAELVGLDREIRDEEIEIDPRFAGPDYGLPDEATIAVIRAAARWTCCRSREIRS